MGICLRLWGGMGFDGVGTEDCGLLGVDVLGRMGGYEG
jgi:hypothetical protein